jgi:FtsH-binding integral membrane protein
MIDNQNNFSSTDTFAQSKSFDEGLRTHMIRIFNTVAAGLGISGAVAYAVASIPALAAIFMNPAVVLGMGIGMMLFLWFGMSPAKMMQQSLASAQIKYYLFTAAMGTTLAYVFLIYTQGSLARVFFITASMFLATSLYGYTTKRDLTGIGTFLFMGLIGLIIASAVNMFLHSNGMSYVISWVGVLIFTGLIAFDTQNAKRLYAGSASDETNRKLAIYSSLGLYLNFINLMQFLLQLLGDRR